MAKYDVDYACGHGSYVEQLIGPTAGRDSRLEWLRANKVCPDCYKARKQAEDAAADKTARICLVPGSEPVISIEVAGQIEANKAALYSLGYRWSDSTADGLLGYFSMRAPKRALVLMHQLVSVDASAAWISQQQAALASLGYRIAQSLSDIDVAYLARLLGKQQEATDAKAASRAALDEIKRTDPRPASSPLRQRIAKMERERGERWSSKLYGRAGNYSFYVANEKHSASDAEVAERERINAAMDAWDAKHAAAITAAI